MKSIILKTFQTIKDHSLLIFTIAVIICFILFELWLYWE